MTEHINPGGEIGNAVPENRLENEKRLNSILQSILQNGAIMESKEYNTSEDAKAISAEFVHEYMEELSSLADFRFTPLIARGEEVLICNVLPENATESTVTFGIDEHQPLSKLQPLESRDFVFGGLISTSKELNNGNYRPGALIMGEETKTVKKWQPKMDIGIPLMTVSVTKSLLVPCNGNNVEIEVVEVVDDESRKQALEDLVAQTNRKDFVHDMDVIQEELANETAVFKDFKQTATLRALGYKGMHYAAGEERNASLLYTALATTLGKGRQVCVEGEVYFINTENNIDEATVQSVTANILDVVPNVPTMNKSRGPTLALSTSNPDRIAYAPLIVIKKFKF